MQRHERLGRTYTRAAAAGIALSVAAHAAALAFIKLDMPGAGEEEAAAAAAPETPEVAQVVKQPVMQVVALRATRAADAAAPSSPSVPAPAAAAQVEATAAPMAQPAVAMAEVVDVPAAALPLAEPEAAPGGAPLAGEAAEAAALPDALRPEPADGEEAEEYELPPGVTLYDPGSVGRAKGKWAGAAGGHELEGRRRAIVVVRPGRDGRRCPPLPGRFWLRGGASQHSGHPPGH